MNKAVCNSQAASVRVGLFSRWAISKIVSAPSRQNRGAFVADVPQTFHLGVGLPREMVYRHPFPGPGLGVRILGEVKKEYADLLRRADAIFIEELRNFTDDTGKSWYDLTSKAPSGAFFLVHSNRYVPA